MASDRPPAGGGRHVVGLAAELEPGQRKLVRCAGRELGVFNVGGKFHALLNRCPHKGAPLCRGTVRPLAVATDVYQVKFEREGQILKCPWHQWEFDITTGRAICDPELRARHYPVAIENGELVIYLERPPVPPGD